MLIVLLFFVSKLISNNIIKYSNKIHTVPGSTVPTRGEIVIGPFSGISNWNDVGPTEANSPK